jgi:molybdenum cofactor cytidylyltransferase
MTVLGDQPRIQSRIVAQVMMAYAEGKGEIIAPSYQMRRGHPILISRRFWPELLALGPGAAPRDVINAHADQTGYVEVNTDSVLRDVDTMQDYEQERKNAGLRP